MGDNSNIQWTEATWNPLYGCTKISPACAHCYIEHTPPFRIAGLKFVKGHIPLQFHEERLAQPLHWKRPRMIFVNSLSDLFHADVPDAFIDRVFAVMALAPQHTFQVLTKRPERMRAYLQKLGQSSQFFRMQDAATEFGYSFTWKGLSLLPFPFKNVWLGVSVENQHFADERIPLLLDTPAEIRWVSYEPALGPVDFLPWMKMFRNDHVVDPTGVAYNSLDWIVVGGESGDHPREFDLAWALSVIEAGRVAGVPVFVKQLGARPVRRVVYGPMAWTGDEQVHVERLALKHRKGGDQAEWPPDLRVREYPKAA